MNEICNICGRPIADHKDGFACCKWCGSANQQKHTTPFGHLNKIECAICKNGTLAATSREQAILLWNLQPQISPWIFAPLPEEGEKQELVVTAASRSGRFFVLVADWVVYSGYNGGEPRIERRYWKDGKLVYEREE